MFKNIRNEKNNIKTKKYSIICYLHEVIILFFFFILGIVIILLIVVLAIHTSRIEIEVENLIINTEMPKGEKINEQSKIYVYLLIFGKIKLFKKDARKMKKPNFKVENKNIDIKILKNKDLKINYKELFQNIDIDVKQIDLYAQIGTQDAALTAIIVGVISGMLGVILRKPKYQINPVYSNKNLLKIKLDGIFSVYLMQYIYKLVFRKMGQKIPGPKWEMAQKIPGPKWDKSLRM